MLTCPSCGKENPDGFRFCGFCTAPLADGQRPSASEERKIVTVLFCDLVGFTAASDSADPEDVRAKIRPYHQMLRAEIEAYGGTVEKFIGDAVMAVFGAPLAHEDDAERAVRAGLRILEAIEELNEGDPGLDLTVRVGIETGEAVVALGARPEQGEGIVTGDVVNTASRLQSAAPVGGVGVGERTYRATDRIFDYEELDAVTLKGKTEPVRIWWAKEARARFGVDVARSYSTPFIGRELERNLLIATFERSVRDASAQLITVVGEPGVGKTRLVDELLVYIEERPGELITWRQGRCLPYGDGIAFWALGEIVKAHAGILESDSSETTSSKLDLAIAADDADRGWLKARLSPLVGLKTEEKAEREEAFTAWRRYLESIAAAGPAVFVFEDIHWADEAMLGFLEHLAGWSESVPMLICGTARPELYDRHASWGGGLRNSSTISLGALTNAETSTLIASLLDRAVLPAETHALLLERTGGNPLYAEEFVRMLRDRELLIEHGPSITLAAGAEVPFPATIGSLIAARLDTLPPERKRLLQAASVIGKVFWSGALEQMTGVDHVTMTEAMHELTRKELVRPARTSSVEGEVEYVFWHALGRDVCYAQIPRAARAEMHVAAARWIEERAGDRVGDLADVLADHYSEAIALTKTLGSSPDVAQLETKARGFLVMAGDRALGLDVAQAEGRFARALELTPVGRDERAPILVRWGDALRQEARYAEAVPALEEAIDAFRERDEVRDAGTAMLILAGTLITSDEASTGLDVTDRAVRLLETEPPGPELVRAYGDIASTRANITSDLSEAIRWAEKAMALSRELGLGEDARGLGVRGSARCDLGDVGGLDDLRRAIVLGLERGLGRDVALHRNNLGIALSLIVGPIDARRELELGLEFAERRGIEEFVFAIEGSIIEQLYELGDWDRLLARVDRMNDRVEAQGATWDLLVTRPVQARIFTSRGRLEEAARLVSWMLPASRDQGVTPLRVSSLAVGVDFSLATGDRAAGLELAAELESIPNVREAWSLPTYLPGLVRTVIALGDQHLAGRLIDGVRPVSQFHQHSLAMVEAEFTEARGDLERAATLYGDASERWERFRVVPELGHALLGQGRCLKAAGSSAADAILREARRVFSGLGARPRVAEIDALLQQAALRSS